MPEIVNFRLLANPLNWVVIFAVLYITALIAKIVYSAAASGQSPIPLPFSNAG